MGLLGLLRQVQGGHPLIRLLCRAVVDANLALEKPLNSLSRVHPRCSTSPPRVRHSILPATSYQGRRRLIFTEGKSQASSLLATRSSSSRIGVQVMTPMVTHAY